MSTTSNPLKRLAQALGIVSVLMMVLTSACVPNPFASSVNSQHEDGAALGDSDRSEPVIIGAPGLPLLNGDISSPAQSWTVGFQLAKCWGEVTSCDPGAAYEVLHGHRNLLTSVGALQLFRGLSGAAITGGAYNTTNAVIAVGDAGGGSSNVPNPLYQANVGDVDVSAGFNQLATISSSTCSAGVVTLTTSAHGLSNSLDAGQVIEIYNPSVTGTGYTAATAGYQGVFTLASVPSTTTLTYNLNNSGVCPTSNLAAQGSVRTGSAILAATATSCTSGTTTVTVANSLVAGQTVVGTGNVPSGYNGTYTVASASGTQFTFAQTCPAANTTLGHWVGSNRVRQQANATGSAVLTATNGINYVATFGTTQANWTWGSWGLDNGGATNQAFANLLNHAVVGPAGGQGLGTKTSASSWTLTITLSLS